MQTERVVENLNRGLHELLQSEPRAVLIGQDIADPHGGVFKVTRGLSSKYPDRVLASPISENAMVGFAAGLALEGYRPIVEIMFGDFITLAYDPIINFATKSVTMYGRRIPMNLLIRCPVGGGRGYGPTHSQSVQKFFLGIPNLELFEVNQFVQSPLLLRRLVDRGCPCILFESKALYGAAMCKSGLVHDWLEYDVHGPNQDIIRIQPRESIRARALVITTGSCVDRCLEAMQELFIEHELELCVVVMTQIYPIDLDTLASWIQLTGRVFVVEESSAGGTWGSEVACEIHQRFWDALHMPVQLVQSKDSVIPAASHLETRVLVQTQDICSAVLEAMHND